MRLTLINMVKVRREPRFIYRGKYRLVKKVEMPALRERYDDYQRQEKNMFILRHPYLTVEQSKGHMAEFKEPLAMKKRMIEGRNEKFSKTLTWAEQLSHLRVKDAWE